MRRARLLVCIGVFQIVAVWTFHRYLASAPNRSSDPLTSNAQATELLPPHTIDVAPHSIPSLTERLNKDAIFVKAIMPMDQAPMDQAPEHRSSLPHHLWARSLLQLANNTDTNTQNKTNNKLYVFCTDIVHGIFEVAGNLSQQVGQAVVVVVPRVSLRVADTLHKPHTASPITAITFDLGSGNAVIMVDFEERLDQQGSGLGFGVGFGTHRLLQLAVMELTDVLLAVDGDDYKVALSLSLPTIVLFTDQRLGARGHVMSPLFGATLAAQLAPHVTAIISDRDVAVCFHSYLNPVGGYGRSALDMARALDTHLASRIAAENILRNNNTDSVDQQRQQRPPQQSIAFIVKGGGGVDKLEEHSEITPQDRAMLALGRRRNIRCQAYVGYFVPHEDDVRELHRAARLAKWRAIYTTFETTRVPVLWPGLINRYDMLLVSCEGVKAAFRNTGVTVPIHVVPLGVQPGDWPVAHRDHTLHAQTFRFVLFADADWVHHRKNFQLAVDAFALAFPLELRNPSNTPRVELWVKLTPPREHPPSPSLSPSLSPSVSRSPSPPPLNPTAVATPPVSASRSRSRSRSASRTASPSPSPSECLHPPLGVTLLVNRATTRELVNLLHNATCMVFPSHGEGFGLPPREAMSTGAAVILAGFLGLEPLARDSIAIPVPFSLAPAHGYDVWNPENNFSSDFGNWAQISTADLANAMRFAHENVQEVLNRGMRASRYVREHESYNHTVDALLALLPFN